MAEKVLSEHWNEAKRIVRERRERGEPEFPTGLTCLDEATGGFNRGEIWVIAGKSGRGKTNLALQLAREFADNPKSTILFLSLEMKGWQLTLRMFSSMHNLRVKDLEHGKIEIPMEKEGIFDAYVDSINFEVIEQGYRFNDIVKIIEEQYKTKRPDVIFLDFIQQIEWKEHGDQRLALMEYIRKIKEMANTYNIGFVIVSQLRRQPSGADYNRPPDMSDLHGSGSLEQMADKVILLYSIIEEGMPTKSMIQLAKNRQGEQFLKQIIFEGDYCRFRDIEDDPEVKRYKEEFNGEVV